MVASTILEQHWFRASYTFGFQSWIVYDTSRLDGYTELLGWQRHGEEEEVTTTTAITATACFFYFCLSFFQCNFLAKITKW